jgi:glycosyltransferase involved in cell wall biosynthesis
MNILFISHNPYAGNSHFGGTEYIFKEVSESFAAAEINFFTMTPLIGPSSITWQIHKAENLITSFKQLRSTTEPYFFGNQEYSNWLSSFLLHNRINVVHVFHHLWTPLSTIPIANSLGIGTVLSIHDFSHICDSFNLLDETSSYCGTLEKKNSSKCELCTIRRGSSIDRLTLLRASFFNLFQRVDVITVGTLFSKTHLIQFYNLDSAKIHILPPTVKTKMPPKLKEAKSVLFMGNFTIPKGARLILEILRSGNLDSFQFTQAGRIDPEFVSELNEIAKSQKNIKVLGQYSLGKIPDFAASIAFFGSIWPETYCIAATEALEMGLKIVVPEIGAFIDRFVGIDNVFFYQPNNLSSAINAILLAEKSTYIIKESHDNQAYSQNIFEIYTSLNLAYSASPTLSTNFDSWQTSNLSLLGIKASDLDFHKMRSVNLLTVFIARSRSVGVNSAIKSAYKYVQRRLK